MAEKWESRNERESSCSQVVRKKSRESTGCMIPDATRTVRGKCT